MFFFFFPPFILMDYVVHICGRHSPLHGSLKIRSEGLIRLIVLIHMLDFSNVIEHFFIYLLAS